MQKKKRIVDVKLLQEVKKKPCLVCGYSPTDPCHIKSKGSGGNDIELNVLPLCRPCHTEQHTKGIKTFILLHPSLWKYLTQLGWSFEGDRLYHPRA